MPEIQKYNESICYLSSLITMYPHTLQLSIYNPLTLLVKLFSSSGFVSITVINSVTQTTSLHYFDWAQYVLSCEHGQVGRVLTSCLRQYQLIISLMIWAPDMRPWRMQAEKMHTQCCLHKSAISVQGRAGTEERGRESGRGRWGNYGTQMCVIGGSLGSQGWRVQRKADYCSPSGQAFINKQGESPRLRVLAWLAYHTAYRQGTYHITAWLSSEHTEVTCTGLLSTHLCSLEESSGEGINHISTRLWQLRRLTSLHAGCQTAEETVGFILDKGGPEQKWWKA